MRFSANIEAKICQTV